MAFYSDNIEEMISSEKLQARIAELGQEITRDYQGKELVLVCIMKGSIYFFTDLSRHIDLPLVVEMMGVSSYQGGTETTGEVRVTHDLSRPVHGKHVLLVEDIVDTGLTMKFLLENFKARGPASVKLVSLLEKPARAKVKVPIDYKGFVIEDRFVVGYGLDYGDKYRNIPFVGVMRTD